MAVRELLARLKRTVVDDPRYRPLLIAALGAVGVGSFALAVKFVPPAVDWRDTFRPAAWEVIAGRPPYNVPGFIYPPWALLPLIPFAALPEKIGQVAVAFLGLAALGYSGYRLGAKPLALALIMLSPPTLHGALNGNIDWLVTLGFVLPPRLGLFFVIIKPQVGLAVAVFWFIEGWRESGWRRVASDFGPVVIALLLSFIIFGFWPLGFERRLGFWWNTSLWPMSIPVGLALLVMAVRERRLAFAIGASPCLSPYVLFHSWIGALLAVSTSWPEMLAAVLGLWLVVGIRLLEMFPL